MSRWQFKTPNMRVWRTMRYDTTEDKFWALRVKELWSEAVTEPQKENACLYTDVRNKRVQIVYGATAEMYEGVLGRDDWSGFNHGDKYKRTLNGRMYPNAAGHPYNGAALPSHYEDLAELERLAKLIDGERHIADASTNLETLVSTLLGEGLKEKRMEMDRWSNKWVVTLKYDGYTVEITQE